MIDDSKNKLEAANWLEQANRLGRPFRPFESEILNVLFCFSFLFFFYKVKEKKKFTEKEKREKI